MNINEQQQLTRVESITQDTPQQPRSLHVARRGRPFRPGSPGKLPSAIRFSQEAPNILFKHVKLYLLLGHISQTFTEPEPQPGDHRHSRGSELQAVRHVYQFEYFESSPARILVLCITRTNATVERSASNEPSDDTQTEVIPVDPSESQLSQDDLQAVD